MASAPCSPQRAPVQERLLVGQVGGALVGVLTGVLVQAGAGGGSSEGAGNASRVTLQDGLGVFAHPGFRIWVAFAVEGPGRLPDIFQDVHEVDDDRYGDVAAGGFGLDPQDLVDVAVDQRDPGPLMVGVAPVGLVEDRGDDGCGVVDDAGGEPLVACARSRGGVSSLGVVSGQDVGGAARDGGDVVDRTDLGHPLAAAFLAFGQSGREFGVRAGCGLGGRCA